MSETKRFKVCPECRGHSETSPYLAECYHCGNTGRVEDDKQDDDPVFHTYQRDPHGGAGNCVCGAPERWKSHPHVFQPARVNPDICTCAQSPEAFVHILGPIWSEP